MNKTHFLYMSIINLMVKNGLNDLAKDKVLEYVGHAIKCKCSGAEVFWIGLKKIKEMKVAK